jgi:CDP-4-dehydro-6-deoxyglucose reductase
LKNKIQIKPSNIVFDSISGKNILDSAIESLITLEHSCRSGECRSCLVEVLSGSVKNENGQFVTSGSVLSCQSFAESDVVLRAKYFPELAHIKKKTLPCKVSKIFWVRENIIVINLRIPPAQNFNYLPGQYVNLSYKGVQRSYSIANFKSVDSVIELHIKLIPGGKLSDFFLNEIKEDTLLHLSGPFGTFFVREAPRPIIFIAGGTGFAPIKSMVESLIEQNSLREMHIYWGMPVSKAFYSEIALTWVEYHKNISYIPVVSEPDVLWAGKRGLVHKAIVSDFTNLANYDVYACGSLQMIEAAKKDLLRIGLDDKHFYSDAFIPAV